MRKILFLTVLLAWAPLTAADDTLDLDAYNGQVVVIDFWASWCVPCRRSFPWMNAMHSRYKDDGLLIVAVNVDRESVDAQRFLEKYPAKFMVAYDPNGDLAKKYNVQVMPSSVIIGRDGDLFERHVGFKVKNQDEYEATLQRALNLENK